jgi:hypothetical protein
VRRQGVMTARINNQTVHHRRRCQLVNLATGGTIPSRQSLQPRDLDGSGRQGPLQHRRFDRHLRPRTAHTGNVQVIRFRGFRFEEGRRNAIGLVLPPSFRTSNRSDGRRLKRVAAFGGARAPRWFYRAKDWMRTPIADLVRQDSCLPAAKVSACRKGITRRRRCAAGVPSQGG